MYHTIHEHIFYHTHIVSYNSWALTICQYDIELFLHTIRYVSYDTDNYGLGWIVLSWISTSKGERERERERERKRERMNKWCQFLWWFMSKVELAGTWSISYKSNWPKEPFENLAKHSSHDTNLEVNNIFNAI